ncbi:MAG TPA: hypothetical protein VFJ49_04860 [Methyloceanibacter sp.]|nr:hypothetical protein [Methyloceanibacter sp.]
MAMPATVLSSTFCAGARQKATNIATDNRVSITIDHDTTDPMSIEGLSMAAHAYPVTNQAEIARVIELLGAKFPEYGSMPQPDPAEILIMRAVTEVISLLDYSKGFGHADLIEISEDELT